MGFRRPQFEGVGDATNTGIERFAQQYHPHRTIVVGSGGISVEEFLTMDLAMLFK